MTTLPRDLFEPLTRLRVVRLSENKWLCDCHLAWMVRYLKRHVRSGSMLATNGYIPRCHAPFGLRAKALSELVDSELKCTGTFTYDFFCLSLSHFNLLHYIPNASTHLIPEHVLLNRLARLPTKFHARDLLSGVGLR